MKNVNFSIIKEEAPKLGWIAMQANVGAAAAWGILLLAIAATIVVWDQTKRNVESLALERFNFRTEEIKTQIKQRLHTYELVLRGAVSLFSSSVNVTRVEWATYISELKIENNYPGIQGIGYAVKFPHAQVEEHINEVRQQGFPQYNIWPHTESEEYTSVVFLEPFNWRNQRALGFDMTSEPIRRAAMFHARDTGLATMSGKVTLVQETAENRQGGFLLYLPVYRNMFPLNTTEQRRAALTGYVYSPFRTDDLIDAIVGSIVSDVQFEIFDTQTIAQNNLLYKSSKPNSSEKDIFNFETISAVTLNEHIWTFKFKSLPGLSRALDIKKPRIVLAVGLLVSFLLFAIVWTLATTRRRAIEIAQNMTLEINESKTRLREITSALGEGLYVINAQGNIIFINPAAESLIGWTALEMLGRDAHQLFHWCNERMNIDKNFCPIHADVLEGQTINRDNEIFCKKDGSTIFVQVIASPIIRNNEIEGAVVAFHDITDRKRAEVQLRESERFKMLFEYATDAFFLVGENSQIFDVNRLACESLKYTREELLKLTPDELIQGCQGDEKNKSWQDIFASVRERKNLRLNLLVPRKDGERFSAEVVVNTIDFDHRWLALVSMRDITERKKSEETLKKTLWELEQAKDQTEETNRRLAEMNFRLQTLSLQDPLTGVGNRRFFDEHLKKEWRRAVRYEHFVAIIFADVDNFKAYNDSYGHQTGDECLKKIAITLSATISRPSDVLVRYGGEEFVLLLPDTALDGACQIAEQLRESIFNLKIPHNNSSVSNYVTISLGVSATTATSDVKPEELIHCADKALYEAKNGGRNKVCCMRFDHCKDRH